MRRCWRIRGSRERRSMTAGRCSLPAALDSETRSRITDIYISHEHPDHFSPPSLSQFAGDDAPRLLVQKTRRSPCRQVLLVARIRSDGNAESSALRARPRVRRRVRSTPAHGLVVPRRRRRYHRAESEPLLDHRSCASASCPVNHRTDRCSVHTVLVRELGRQSRRTSTAQDYGSRSSVTSRRRSTFSSRGTSCPSRSFFRFCHEENAHLNDVIPPLRNVVRFIADNTVATPVSVCIPETRGVRARIMTTGRRSSGTKRGTPKSSCSDAPDRGRSRSSSTLPSSSVGGYRHATTWPRFASMEACRFLPAGSCPSPRYRRHGGGPLRTRGLRTTEDPPHVEMSSDSLAFAFEHDFGAETLYVNGRYKVLSGPDKLLFRHFYPAILEQSGVLVSCRRRAVRRPGEDLVACSGRTRSADVPAPLGETASQASGASRSAIAELRDDVFAELGERLRRREVAEPGVDAFDASFGQRP